MWDQMGVYGITNTTALPNSYLFATNLFTIGTRNVDNVMVRIEHNGLIAGLGADVGVTIPLHSEGTYYQKSMTKSAGGQFEWYIQNLPLFVGMSGQSEGDQIKFNIVQI